MTETGKHVNAPKTGLSGGILLAVLAAICTALVSVTYKVTAARIDANDMAFLEKSLQPVFGGIEYENELSRSELVLEPPHELPGRKPVTIYRIYADGEAAAAVFLLSAPGGYGGPIELLIGVRIDGSITSVRVLDHMETPGLGDRIESGKSDWLLQFDGRSLGDPAAEDWAIERDGGTFDQLTGASITPRAVVEALRLTLEWFSSEREWLFAQAAPGDTDE